MIFAFKPSYLFVMSMIFSEPRFLVVRIMPSQTFEQTPLGTDPSDHMLARQETIMTHALNQISPLDAEYVEHREAAERRRETREWLKKRESELGFVKDAPPVVPGTKSQQ
jgi:hypothetical protein